MRHTILFLFLPACAMGLDSTIVDEEGNPLSFDEDMSDEGTGSDDGSDSIDDEEDPYLSMDLDGIYEAPEAFYIDVDAIDGSSGDILASDTCIGELTIEINMEKSPPVFGRGTCTLQNFDIEGEGELIGTVDLSTGDIEGWVTLSLDTEIVEVPWNGSADEQSVIGTFEGSLPYSDTNYNLDLDYLGEFEADR